MSRIKLYNNYFIEVEKDKCYTLVQDRKKTFKNGKMPKNEEDVNKPYTAVIGYYGSMMAALKAFRKCAIKDDICDMDIVTLEDTVGIINNNNRKLEDMLSKLDC